MPVVAAAADLKKLTDAAPEVKATGFALPAGEAFRESLEAMLLAPQGPVTVTDNYARIREPGRESRGAGIQQV